MNLVNLDNNTYGIAVSIEAKAFDIVKGDLFYLAYLKSYAGFGFVTHMKNLNSDNFEILGTASLSEITFDCEEVITKDAEDLGYPYYENREGKNAICFCVKQSFLSLLKSKGLMPTEETKILILKAK